MTPKYVLSHPFLIGRNQPLRPSLPSRLQGEQARYVRCLPVAQCRQRCGPRGVPRELTVWLDRECLLPGQPWEEGSSEGRSRQLGLGHLRLPAVPGSHPPPHETVAVLLEDDGDLP